MKKRAISAVSVFLVCAGCIGIPALLEAGANSGLKIAIHVVPHGLSCKSLPTFTECSQIATTDSSTGDIDVVPVFFGLTQYTVVEFGLTWPAQWGSCEYVTCVPTMNIGGITNSGDGIASAWTTCQTGWSVSHGYGWLNATGAGSVSIVPNPATGDYGVVDCSEEPGPYYDRPDTTFSAGVGGSSGDDPCGSGGRDGGKGGEGNLPALRIARTIDVTDGTTEYMQPIWSPDGMRLAFTRPGFTGIYVKNADGSGSVREVCSAPYSGNKPIWTPDSKGILVRARVERVGQDIDYIDVNSGEVKVLEHAGHAGEPERNFYGDVAIDVDGQSKVLADDTSRLGSKEEYYSGDRRASQDLRLERDTRESGKWFIVEGDGSHRVEFPQSALLASLSPTRDQVAFLQGDGNLRIAHLDGSAMVILGRGSADWDWSPDGKWLVYVGGEEDNGYTTIASDIFVASSDGSSIIQLTNTRGTAEIFPRWSPDGNRIAYSTHRTGRICVAILEGAR